VNLGGRSDKIGRFEKHVLVYLNDLNRAARRLTEQAADADYLV
jgi:hypothetical protein